MPKCVALALRWIFQVSFSGSHKKDVTKYFPTHSAALREKPKCCVAGEALAKGDVSSSEFGRK